MQTCYVGQTLGNNVASIHSSEYGSLFKITGILQCPDGEYSWYFLEIMLSRNIPRS